MKERAKKGPQKSARIRECFWLDPRAKAAAATAAS